MSNIAVAFKETPSKIVTKDGDITKPFYMRPNQLLSMIETPNGDIKLKYPEFFPDNFNYAGSRDVTILGHSQIVSWYAAAANEWNVQFGSGHIRYLNDVFYTDYDFTTSSALKAYRSYAHQMGSGDSPPIVTEIVKNDFLKLIDGMTWQVTVSRGWRIPWNRLDEFNEKLKFYLYLEKRGSDWWIKTEEYSRSSRYDVYTLHIPDWQVLKPDGTLTDIAHSYTSASRGTEVQVSLNTKANRGFSIRVKANNDHEKEFEGIAFVLTSVK